MKKKKVIRQPIKMTPGTLLKSARTARGMTPREAADRLHLMPDYVGILERDDYQALRSPPFARRAVQSQTPAQQRYQPSQRTSSMAQGRCTSPQRRFRRPRESGA